MLCKFIKLKMGLGEEIKLWVSNWCGTVSLKETFGRIYSIMANEQKES